MSYLKPRWTLSCRTFSASSRIQPSRFYTEISHDQELAVRTTPSNLTYAQNLALESALRVDQAGEIAANHIYQGQLMFLKHNSKTRSLIQDMWEQEKKHLFVLDKLQLQYNIRPTVLSEVAKFAGFGLGAVTALMGEEAALACTEAVETVIGEHYDDQLSEMEFLSSSHPSIPLLKGVIREFRDDELEHLDIAVINLSQRVPAHALLSAVVGEGCKIAIELCKRI